MNTPFEQLPFFKKNIETKSLFSIDLDRLFQQFLHSNKIREVEFYE